MFYLGFVEIACASQEMVDSPGHYSIKTGTLHKIVMY